VIRKLCKAMDQGRSVAYMKSLLENFPLELDSLFDDIFKSIDSSLLAETRTLFLWVLFSCRPLCLDEIQLVFAFGSPNPPSSISDWTSSMKGWERLEGSQIRRRRQLRKLVTEASGGLVEVVQLRKDATNIAKVESKDSKNPDESEDYDQSLNLDIPGKPDINNNECILKESKFSDNLDSTNALDVPDDSLEFLEDGCFILQVIQEAIRDFLFADGMPRLLEIEPCRGPGIECHGFLYQVCKPSYSALSSITVSPKSGHIKLFSANPPPKVITASEWTRKTFISYAI
jgi:hypothetical protein